MANPPSSIFPLELTYSCISPQAICICLELPSCILDVNYDGNNLSQPISLPRRQLFLSRLSQDTTATGERTTSQEMEYCSILEGMARFSGLLLATADGFGLRSSLFFYIRAKKEPCYADFGVFMHLMVFNSNLLFFYPSK